MTFLLVVFSVVLGFGLLGTLVHWVALRGTGIGVEKVIVFYGRELVALPWFGTTLVIGWIPTGGSVKFDLPQYGRLPLLARLAVGLSAPAVLLAVAVALLGGGEAWHHFSSGFAQLIEGALHPLTVGVHLLEELNVVFSASGWALAGVLAAKLAAFNLLPWGGSTGARSIREVVDRQGESRWFNGYEVFSGIAVMALVVSWGIAWWRYVTLG